MKSRAVMTQSDISQDRPKGVNSKRSDFRVFLRGLLNKPKAVGAISPSGPFLANAMVKEIPAADGKADLIIELGPGTGSLTSAILGNGMDPASCVSVEFNSSFLPYLHEKFPSIRFIEGDATKLDAVLGPHGWWKPNQYRAVISCVPLRNMPPSMHRAILGHSMRLLRPGGIFVQFTYGPSNSLDRTVLKELGLKSERTAFIWRNLPPASVWTIRKPA